MSALAVGFVLFPNLTQLDLTGPLQVLHRLPGATVHIAAKTLEPVPSDCGRSCRRLTAAERSWASAGHRSSVRRRQARRRCSFTIS